MLNLNLWQPQQRRHLGGGEKSLPKLVSGSPGGFQRVLFSLHIVVVLPRCRREAILEMTPTVTLAGVAFCLLTSFRARDHSTHTSPHYPLTTALEPALITPIPQPSYLPSLNPHCNPRICQARPGGEHH